MHQAKTADIQHKVSVRITPMAQRLLGVLSEQDDWINRSDLAQLMQKSALNKWDVVLLGKLAEHDFIATRKVSHHGPIGYEWQYRALHLDSDAENKT